MGKILIIGASRGIGLQAVKMAIAKEHAVRAFSRSASDIIYSSAMLEKIDGDAMKSADIESAVSGCDAVIQALGVPIDVRMFAGPMTLFSKATSVLLPAMQRLGVKRLISVTGFGAGDSRAQMPSLQRVGFNIVLGRVYDDKDIQESLIRASNLDWTIARPVILTNASKTDRYEILTEPAEWRYGLISRADVADFLISEIDRSSYLRQTPVLRGTSI